MNSAKMKRINKILIILILPLMVEIVISCCDCPETTILNYTNCSLFVTNLDNSGESPIISQSDSISKNAYGIKLSIIRNENTCELKKRNSIFIQSAYAYDCFCPPEIEYMPLDSIVSISITTTHDFDSEHLEYSDVSEYFYVFEYNEFTSIADYISSIETSIPDYFESTYEFDLLLMTPPTLGTEHQFEVNVELSDGRILSTQTEKIVLK
jgi:hypothetical protein